MRAAENLRSFIRQISNTVFFLKVCFTAGGVGLLAVSHKYRASEEPYYQGLSEAMFWFGLVLAIVGGFFVAFVDKDKFRVISDFHDVEKENKELKEAEIEAENYASFMEAWVSVLPPMREFSDFAITERITEGRLSLFAETTVRLLADSREQLLGIGNEHWNIAIYAHSGADDELHCLAYERAGRAASVAPRAWKRGEGHVGFTFDKNVELILPDVNVPGILPFVTPPPQKQKPSDKSRYVSIAAFPIAMETADPLGVLIATSNVPSRFANEPEASDDGRHPQSLQPMREIAAFLAQLMYVYNRQEAREGNSDG